ncbi:MAG: molybdenum cofactor carrier, partial [Rhodospirillaceae bacterium]|nr:molybdenum cofactor carrier [Rhodospirillaceae bacterium]
MSRSYVIDKIISGGQTGVDRAALDAALRLGIDCAGWCPLGRWAEDGEIAAHYPVLETESPDPAERTSLNVSESDGTLVLGDEGLDDGSMLTVELAQKL